MTESEMRTSQLTIQFTLPVDPNCIRQHRVERYAIHMAFQVSLFSLDGALKEEIVECLGCSCLEKVNKHPYLQKH